MSVFEQLVKSSIDDKIKSKGEKTIRTFPAIRNHSNGSECVFSFLIKSVQTIINKTNEQYQLYGKGFILFVKDKLINKSVEFYYNQLKCDLDLEMNNFQFL